VELERVIARLAVMTDGRPIRREDIVAHAPWIVGPPDAGSDRGSAPAAPPAPHGEDHWVRCAISKDTTALAGLHDALRRSLLYLGENYAEPISLDHLTRQVHVSPSHLSFLFRSELQTSFKTLLGRIRVLKAQEILAADTRRQITDVSMSVGFADLSHFEKSFRKIVGLSPREFRRKAAEVTALERTSSK